MKMILRIFGLLVLATAAGLVAACSVVETVEIADVGASPTCRTAAGAYFLPKRQVSIVVSKKADSEAGAAPYVLAIDPVKSTTVADRNAMYCLDFLGSITSDDSLKVKRSNGLLTSVSSVTDDKSKEIATKLLEIGTTVASGYPRSGRALIRPDQLSVLTELLIDPFDRGALAEANATLVTYGYCLLVDGHTIDAASADRYCAAPMSHAGAPEASSARPARIPSPQAARGILYRAEATHEFSVLRRRDPDSGGPWSLYKTLAFEAPNVSPTFSVAVDRSYFVRRQTTLTFKDGVLQDIEIDKPSEALEVAELPLTIVQALVAIPAQIVQVKIAAVDNRRRLIEAQRELIRTREDRMTAQEELRTGTLGTRSRALAVPMTRRVLPAQPLETPPDLMKHCRFAKCNKVEYSESQKIECTNRCADSVNACETGDVSRRAECVDAFHDT